ncbi:uncharacterized protein BO95DRAFT_438544 [Aspergillus brunneoviolaceus CBS 621.78]|uniref:Uncharacterized protein n=1 Tax=Aspergillus brunneoviolaceus CBS 621.78 TaxID=1450534 RepID=A0ACD1GM72_9EURO|nr:hypothetical protein BO95DRAFT_438544 [Aspergillus brunneoviolaceus CBS 621.78]RAH50209.1 hypothetical protein BO95DRAFT_438544 [Aspergillus brunneoviolaceus CBS 621.78]
MRGSAPVGSGEAVHPAGMALNRGRSNTRLSKRQSLGEAEAEAGKGQIERARRGGRRRRRRKKKNGLADLVFEFPDIKPKATRQLTN